jgi:hypothetical protein
MPLTESIIGNNLFSGRRWRRHVPRRQGNSATYDKKKNENDEGASDKLHDAAINQSG